MGEEEEGNFGKGFFGGEVDKFGRVGMRIGGRLSRGFCVNGRYVLICCRGCG